MRELDHEEAYAYLTKYAGHFRGWPIDLEDLVHEAYMQVLRNAHWPVPRALLWKVLRFRAIAAFKHWQMRVKYIPLSLDYGWDQEDEAPDHDWLLADGPEEQLLLRELVARTLEAARPRKRFAYILPPLVYLPSTKVGELTGERPAEVRRLQAGLRRELREKVRR